ncbi:hypothetical protein ADIARSV_2242 [Arcticibacter svalbardensis MN12-7]|uniref:Uncharacterized protein n=1 Tax=Arcticibacter svalbardensis MN12-7 TaxID=1150600 RepID=R9H0B5_9SPHI|nr:hypothetical protein [Arcticibacter svalbardensis]EOR94644.1 hypothetical protein ADIARSV_2242 [Arcticibacter svalbardensis MN12-7]
MISGNVIKLQMMSIKKIVIFPTNTKAIAFFNEMADKKTEIFKKIDNITLVRQITQKKEK